jgi:DNA-binding beta-propeller fold protein YncE
VRAIDDGEGAPPGGHGKTRQPLDRLSGHLDRRTRARVISLCVLVSFAALVWSCAPALALVHRGHTFESSFGQPGSEPGQFDNPTGVAADEVSGELYVVDAGNERVEIFSPNGSGGYDFSSEFKVRSPGAIAVDNSTSAGDPSRGDVYVVASKEKEAEPEERNVIYEYSPVAKEVVHKWSVFKAKVEKETEELELENIAGLSVDAGGVLWVYWETEGLIDGFDKQLSGNGNPLLVWQPGLRREPEIESKFECFARPGFAVSPTSETFYAAYERKNAAEECPGESFEAPDPVVVATLDGTRFNAPSLRGELATQNTTGVAVDPSNGDVYLDNASTISAFTATGLPIQRFGEGDLTGASGLAVDAQRGEVFVAEPSENKVVVFGPEPASAPTIDGVSSQDLSPSSTELKAQVDPHGVELEYQFQYGTSDCVASPSSCTSLPAGKLAGAFGAEEVHAVVNGLSAASAYFYRILVTTSSSNTIEGVPSPNRFTTLPAPGVLPDGRGWELVSPAEKHGGAAPEMIARYRGGSIQASTDGDALTWLATGPVVTEPEGNRSFEFTQLLSRRDSSAWSTVSLETPHQQGRGLHSPAPSEYHYFSPDLSRSLLQPVEPFGPLETPPLSPDAREKTMYVRPTPPAAATFEPLVTAANDTAGTSFGGQLEFLDATSDLEHVIFESKVGLTAGLPSTAGLYEWESGAPLKLASVLPDGSPAPDEGNTATPVLGGGRGLNTRHAISEDGSRIFWAEEHAEVAEALYLRDTSTGTTIQVNAAQGHGATAPGEGGQEVAEPATQEVAFQSASDDGSKVLFTDTVRLTEDSSLEPTGLELQPADLYEFELTSAEGQPPRGRLTDLTAESSVGRADVLNLIPGTSEDGSRTYFVANGVLAAGATPGDCPRNPEEESEPPTPPPGSTCNLYVIESDPAHPNERETRFIAALSPEDAADWGAGLTSELPPTHGNLSNVTSRVSPDGRYLAFMSQQSLTGYDNRDAASGQPDEEVYLYDAVARRLLCASCNSQVGEGDGWMRPLGVFDTEQSGEGIGLLVDRPELWRNRWLASSIPGWAFNITGLRPLALYQPRYLSDEGRLYFDSADALVPQDINGKEDVYQYEPSGVGDCRPSGGCAGLISSGTGDSSSAFLDASENGDDVFFLSAAQIVATDTDRAADVYDAHVCTSSSPCIVAKVPSSEECSGTSDCRGAGASSPPPEQAPASSTFSGPGNIAASGVQGAKAKAKLKTKPLTRAQKLARALKKCRKQKDKHKRAVCQKQARKRFGAKVKAKKHAMSGKRGR